LVLMTVMMNSFCCLSDGAARFGEQPRQTETASTPLGLIHAVGILAPKVVDIRESQDNRPFRGTGTSVA
jgi:hypothetical protein